MARDKDKNPGVDDEGDPDAGLVSLGDAAKSALATIGDDHGAQGELDGMDYTKVRFVGVQFDALETEVKMNDEMTFQVRGRVVGIGDEVMADGHIRHYAKVKVESVTLNDMGLD